MTDSRPIFPVVFPGKSSEGTTLDTSGPVVPRKHEALTRAVDGSNVRDFRPVMGVGPEAPKASPVPANVEPSRDEDLTLSPDSTVNPVIAEKESQPISGSDGEQQPPPTLNPTTGSSLLLVEMSAPSEGGTPTSSSPEQ